MTAFPVPQLGMVISYAYRWYFPHRAGRDVGATGRPCVVVLAARNTRTGATIVRVAPLTYGPPGSMETAFELPQSVRRRLGVGDNRSWVAIDEFNEFLWPGFDLRTVPGPQDGFAYGFLPPRLFDAMMARLVEAWTLAKAKDGAV